MSARGETQTITRTDSARRAALPHSVSVIPGEPLTPREIEVLTLVAHGNTYKEAARALSVSPQTIKNHMVNVLIKLDAWNAAHAVYLYFCGGARVGESKKE